jgi:hypothetical protein
MDGLIIKLNDPSAGSLCQMGIDALIDEGPGKGSCVGEHDLFPETRDPPSLSLQLNADIPQAGVTPLRNPGVTPLRDG